MILKTLFFSLLIVSINSVPQIDILVESLCPDSIGFIGNSFTKFFNATNSSQLANVTFHFYGNAHQSFNGTSWNFSCQHGANECYGNLIETCVTKNFPKNQSHPFLICLEKYIRAFAANFPKATNYCLTNTTINSTLVWNCVNSDMGNRLQNEVANFTESVNPRHNYVPWVIVDGVHDLYVEDAILNDMLGYLCSKTNNQIKACQKRSKFLDILFEKNPVSKCYRN